MNILLVDDEQFYHDHYQELCRDLGFTFHGAKNGHEALLFFSSKTPIDLIILDYSMPLMNGLEFLEQRAKRKDIIRIPLFMSTSYLPDDPLFQHAITQNWITKFIPKGCKEKELLAAIAER